MTEETTVPNTEEQAGGAEPVAETTVAQDTVEGNAESASEPVAEAPSEATTQDDASASTVSGGEAI